MITPYIPTAEEIARYQLLPQALTPGLTGTPAATSSSSTASFTPYAYGSSSIGSAMVPPQQQPPPRPPLAPCIISAAELSRLQIPRRPALLDAWLREGDLGYIFAPRGVGKTWMAMALPGAISRRQPLGLWQAGDPAPSSPTPSSFSSCSSSTSPSDSDPASSTPATQPDLDLDPPSDHIPVLYVDGEMALELTQYRSAGLQLHHGGVSYLHHEHLFELQSGSLNIGEAEDRQRLTTALLEQGYKVLILDNLSSLASGIDENKGTDYEPVSQWLLELRRRKITVILIHHAGRNGFMRGHTKREDACSWILELRDAKQDGDTGAKFVSHFAKPSRNTGDPLPDLLWHFTSDQDGKTEIHCELAQVSDYEQFVQHVCEGVTTQIDIAEMMNRPRGTISKWTVKALKEGRLSGNPRRLLPPDSAKGTSAPTRSWHDDDFETENE